MNSKLNRVLVSLIKKDKALVKGERFSDHQYVGDPLNVFKIFNDKQVSELTLVDPFVSDLGTSDIEELKLTLKHCFLPLSYGGGINNYEQIKSLQRLGVEKFIFKFPYDQKRPLINECINTLGKQSLILSYEVRRELPLNKFFSKTAKRPNFEEVNDLFGELVVHDVEREGTRLGVNTELINSLKLTEIEIPVIWSGGVRNTQDLRTLALITEIDSAACGAAFIYAGKFKAVNIGYFE